MFDVVLKNGWVIGDPDDDGGRADVGWIGITGSDITAIGSGVPPYRVEGTAGRVYDCAGCIVTPGLINAHTHLSQTFMRGLAVDRPLAQWLFDAVQPMQASMTAMDVERASELGIVENIRCGVTTLVQHHKITHSRAHVEAALRAAEQLGVRMMMARGWRDIGGRGEQAIELDREFRYLVEAWHSKGDGRLRIALGPMAPTSCSTSAMKLLCGTARQLGIGIHIHMAETTSEMIRFRQREGASPVQWLASVGGLGERSQLVHCVHVDDADLHLIQRSGAAVVHCPVSNMRLASGVAPVSRMLDRGIRVCVGTDGSASNDTQDLLETLKQTALLANLVAQRPGAIAPMRLLRLATTSAARALAWPEIGNLKVAQKADVAVFDLHSARAAPVHNPLASMIYSASGVQARHVFVDGRAVVENRKITTIDEDALLRDADAKARALLRRASVVA